MEETLRSQLEGAKLSRSHIKIMLISGMSFFTDAYDLFVIGVALLMLKGIFNLNATQLGIAASAALFGAVLGPMIFGRVADKFGRKKTYWITITILIVGALGSATSSSFLQLVLWRFFLGIGIGGDYPLSSTIVAEYANRNDRGKLVASTFAMQGFGIAAGILVAFSLLYASVPETLAWRLLFAVGAIPSIAILYFRLKFNETPLYDIFRGRIGEAKSTVKSLAGASNAFGGYIPNVSMREFARKHMGIVVSTALCWFLMDISYYGTGIFTPYLASLFGFSGTFAATKVSAIVLLLMAVPGYWVAVSLIDIEGRKRIQEIGFLFMGAAFIILALFGEAILKISAVAFFGIYGLTFFFTNYGPNTTTYVYPSELYPTSIRATGHGIASTSGKLGAAISALAFPLLINAIGKFALIGMLGGIAIVGFFMTLVFLPETKRKSLAETSGEEELMLITLTLQGEFRAHLEHEISAGRILSRMAKSNGRDSAAFFKEIKSHEHNADIEVHKIFDSLYGTKLQSITYVDVSHLANRLDDIIDAIEKAASRISIYGIKLPDKNVTRFASGIEKCVGKVAEGFTLLLKLSTDPESTIKAIGGVRIVAAKYENEADEILRSSLRELAESKDAKSMVELKDVYESLEEVTDRCIDVLDVMSDIMLRYAYQRA
ncbi:MAG: MFS transporter [Candidatus Micrarchaeaceae archaeon]